MNDIGKIDFSQRQSEINAQFPVEGEKKIKPKNFAYGEDDPEFTEDTRKYGYLIGVAAMFIATFFVVGIIDFIKWIISLL